MSEKRSAGLATVEASNDVADLGQQLSPLRRYGRAASDLLLSLDKPSFSPRATAKPV